MYHHTPESQVTLANKGFTKQPRQALNPVSPLPLEHWNYRQGHVKAYLFVTEEGRGHPGVNDLPTEPRRKAKEDITSFYLVNATK